MENRIETLEGLISQMRDISREVWRIALGIPELSYDLPLEIAAKLHGAGTELVNQSGNLEDVCEWLRTNGRSWEIARGGPP